LITKVEWLGSVGCATNLGLAGVLSFATGIAGLAAALALTLVLAFARMFALFSVGQSLKGDAGMARRESRIFPPSTIFSLSLRSAPIWSEVPVERLPGNRKFAA